MKDNVRFMQGNEAMAEGAIAAGARFYAGYPITPSSEIAEILSRKLPQVGGMYIQMEDELASMAAIIGASASGKKSLTATSGPGFSLMQENLGVAIMSEIPCVVINVQRVGPSTGLATKPAQADLMQSRWGTHGDHGIIVLSPSSVEDCYYLMIKAFNYSEKYRVPVIFLADEIIGHMKERAVINEPEEIYNREEPTCPVDEYKPFDHKPGQIAPLAHYGGRYLLRLSSSMHDETGYPCNSAENANNFIRHFYNKIELNKKDITITRKYNMKDAEYVIITFGCSTRSALEAMNILRGRGIKTGVFQVVTVWPFPDYEVKAICRISKAIFVPELNMGQMIGEVEKANSSKTPVIGINKVNSLSINPNEIVKTVEEVIRCL
jgi:2-oxoglutarate ferredoxin oxidoreductase subunit alpha